MAEWERKVDISSVLLHAGGRGVISRVGCSSQVGSARNIACLNFGSVAAASSALTAQVQGWEGGAFRLFIGDIAAGIVLDVQER
jgi:hypothetical protein